MKNKLDFISVLLALCIFFLSCNNNEKDKDTDSKVTNRVLKVDCESMVPKCGNKPGLKFYGERLGMWREKADGEGDYEIVPYDYVVCCEYVPDLIDSLKKADSLRQAWIRDKPELAESNLTFGGADDSINVRVYYKSRWSDAEPGPYSFLCFGNPSQAPVFYISRKEFDEIMKDIEERFRTCCLK